MYQIPGVSGVLRPGLDMSKQVLQSSIGRQLVEADINGRSFRMTNPVLNAIDETLGPGATGTVRGPSIVPPVPDIPFIGSAIDPRYPGVDMTQYPAQGTAMDIIENPQRYALTSRQAALPDAWQGTHDALLADANAHGATIKRFQPDTGGAYVMSKDASPLREAMNENLGQTGPSARSASTTTAERYYQTGLDHWAADQVKVNAGELPPDQAFQPVSNLRQLTASMNQQKANAAGSAVFQAGVGGKTLPEVIAEVNPSVLEARDSLQADIASLKGKMQTAQNAIASNSALASRFAAASETTANRADTLLGQVGNTSADPVIDRIVGGIDELDRTGKGLDAIAQTTAGRAALRTQNLGDFAQQLADLKSKLADVQERYANTNLRDNVPVQEAGGKYFSSKDAGDIKQLAQLQGPGIAKTLGQINGSVFTGDIAPLLGPHSQMMWLSAPVQTASMLASALKQGWQDGGPSGLLHAFDPAALAAKMKADPERWQAFQQATGRAFTPGSGTSGVPLEFNGGWFRSPRLGSVGNKFSQFNDAVYSAVVQGQKEVFDQTVQTLKDSNPGMSQLEAEAVAGQHAMSLIPTPNPAGAGLSDKQAGLLRTPFTSLTFMQRPLQLITDAGEAFVKSAIGQGDTVLPRQKLALNSVMKMSGTALGLAASTSALEALRTGRDPVQAALDAVNPASNNSKFMTVTLPGGINVPLGGPFRAVIRAVAPGPVKVTGSDQPIWVPFAGATSYFQNRVSPALRTPIDLIRNQDFYNKPILTGNFPANVFEAAGYGAQSLAPLAVGAAIGGARAGDTLGQNVTNTVGAFTGTGATAESPTQQLNDFAQQRYGADFYSLEPAQRDALKMTHPDVWKQAMLSGSVNGQLNGAVTSEFKDQQQASDAQLLSGQSSVQDWKTQRTDRAIALHAHQSQIYGDTPVTDAQAATNPSLKYIQTIQQNTNPATGEVNWDAVDAARAQFTDAENAFIDRNTGANDTPLQKLYRDLSTQYYALPKYIGYTAQQANAIDAAYQTVHNYAAQGLLPGTSPDEAQLSLAYVHALPPGIDPQVAQGVRRLVMGLMTTSSQRARFAARTPALALVRGQGALAPKEVAAIQEALAAEPQP